MLDYNKIVDTFFKRRVVTFFPMLDDNRNVLSSDLYDSPESGCYFNMGSHEYVGNMDNVLAHLNLINHLDFEIYNVNAAYSKDQLVYFSLDGNIYSSLKDDNKGKPLSDDEYWSKTHQRPSRSVWASTSSYFSGDIVTNGKAYYMCRNSNSPAEPVNKKFFWERMTPESHAIKQSIRHSITKVVRELFGDNATIDNHIITGTSKVSNSSIQETDKWVGYKFLNPNLLSEIHRICLQFDQPTKLELTLFQGSTLANQFQLEYTGKGEEQWVDIFSLLSKPLTLSPRLDPWFLLYDKTKLSAKPIHRNFGKYSIQSGSVQMVTLATTSESSFVDREVHQSYGLGLDMSVGLDQTPFVLGQLVSLAPLISLQWGYDMMEKMLFNPAVRFNRNERNIDLSALRYELRGEEGNAFWKRLEAEKNRVRKLLDTIRMHRTYLQTVQTNYYEVT